MRLVRVKYKERLFYGVLLEDKVRPLDRELGLPETIPLEELQVYPPVAPTKIICLAANYKDHAKEWGRPVPEEPMLFLKPPSAVIGAGQAIVLPEQSSRVDYEAELAIVLGRTCRDVELEDVSGYLLGYSCANDVTARDLQKKDVIFGRAKGFDTFAPIGPWIETEVEDPSNLTIRCQVNGETRQEGNTSDMAFGPYEIVSFISKVMTLLPGDVILTGTPAGVGPLAPGDEVRVDIPGVGLLINKVVAAGETQAEEEELPPVQ